MQYKNHFVTDNEVVIVMQDGSTRSVKNGNPTYKKLIQALFRGEREKAAELIDLAVHINTVSGGQFKVENGHIYYKKTVMPLSLSERILQFVESGVSFKPLFRFWENCLKNPSKECQKDLFSFLEFCGIPITPDGCFICYKRIKDDWTDHYTGKIDNHVGKVVKMKRKDVDPNRNVTCSRGLHAAAFRYAKEEYSNGKLIAVKINPKDVVAIPTDYNGEKMRVCRYEVMEKVGAPRKVLVYAKFREGAIVAVLPNLDSTEYFVGKVIKVIESTESPRYLIQKVNTDEEVNYHQENVMWLDDDSDGEDFEEDEEEDFDEDDYDEDDYDEEDDS